MKILQLSDLHIMAGGGPAFRKAESLKDLQRTVDYILRADIKPDMVVVTGDVSSDGSEDSYRLVKEQLARLDCPAYVLPGNHDEKEPMAAVLGEMCCTAPGRCITREGVRHLLLDSATAGVSAGGLDREALDWVAAQLAQDRGPVMLWMHHFPFRTGYGVMDAPFAGEEPLLQLLQGREAWVCSGHIHAGMVTRRGSVTLVTCPAVSMLMDLELSPAGGHHFHTAQSGFALHVVDGGSVLSHLCTVPGAASTGPWEFIE